MSLDQSHQLTEDIIHESQLPEHVGDSWRDLARALGYNQPVIEAIEKEKGGCTKECCIAVLVRWMGREGRDATVGVLAEALNKIEKKSLADKLMCADTNQVGSHVKLIISNRNIEQNRNLADNGEIHNRSKTDSW